MHPLVWCIAVGAILTAEAVTKASVTRSHEVHGGNDTRILHAGQDGFVKEMNNTLSQAWRDASEPKKRFDMMEYLKSDVQIETNKKPFVNDGPGNYGTRLVMKGEAKSGTTWLGRVISYIAINLCGNAENTWCEVGGVRRLTKTSSYEFELLDKRSAGVFLHYKDEEKHNIPGTNMICSDGGIVHACSFELRSPCAEEHKAEPLTSQDLVECLPSASPECLYVLPPLDPAIWRVVVIFRDPRDVVISEHEHRIDRDHAKPAELNEFIFQRFETIVSWTYVRWYWHTEVLAATSHIVFYEGLHNDSLTIAGLADFMGLHYTHEQTAALSDALQKGTPSLSYDTNDKLHDETKAYMDAVMIRLLPDTLLQRWQVERNT